MNKKRVASLDYGLKRIGVALSDEGRIIASSLGVIQAGKDFVQTISRILEVLKPYELESIIVGYPLHMNGSMSVLAEEVQRFVSVLKEHVSCEIILHDERLSTAQATRSLKEGGMRRKKRSKIIDAVAAVILLQSYLGY